MKIIKIVFIFLIFSINNAFAGTDSTKVKWDSPVNLRHFISGPLLGIQTGFGPHTNKLMLGLTSTFCSPNEEFALNIDNQFCFNTTNGRWMYDLTLSYRLPFWVSIAYSNEIFKKGKGEYIYSPGIGLSRDEGVYSIGAFMHRKGENSSFISARLIIRPFYLFALINNP